MEHQEAETVCVHCGQPENVHTFQNNLCTDKDHYLYTPLRRFTPAPDTQESRVPREETACDTCHKPIVFVTKGEEISSGQVRDYYRLAGNGEVYDGTHWHSPAPVPDTSGAIPPEMYSAESMGNAHDALHALNVEVANLRSRIGVLEAALRELHTLRPRSEYHEDFGCVLWWSVPIDAPPIVDGYDIDDLDWGYTHWSPLPKNPALATQGKQE